MEAEDYIQYFEQLETERQTFQTHWQEVNDLVRPNAKYFIRDGYVGDRRTLRIYDSTAVLACDELAGGLQSYLVSPSERWFNCVSKIPQIMDDDQCLLYMEIVADLIYTYYSLPKVAFNPTMNEIFGDLAAFGTAGLNQEWDYYRQQPRFRSVPLSDFLIDENAYGNVDVVARRVPFTYRQACEYFGKDQLPEDLVRDAEKLKKDHMHQFQFKHFVRPRDDWDPRKSSNKKFRYESVWIWVDKKPLIIKESGYATNPFVTPRWRKVPNEKYGRSPAMDVLPTIKMVNAAQKIMMGTSEKVMDPATFVPNDGFFAPLRFTPGALIEYDASVGNIRDMIMQLETKANIPVGNEYIQLQQGVIERSFHLDYLRAERKKERQSVQEIQDDRDEMLRQLAPILGRQESELLGQTIGRTFNLLKMNGIIPAPPAKMRGTKLSLEYVSPAARAQSGSKAIEVTRFLQDIIPMAQIDQQIADIIDTDEAAREIALARDVSRRIIRSKRDIAAIRQKRQAQQDAAQQAQTGLNAAKAVQALGQGAQGAATAQSLQINNSSARSIS